MSSHSLLMILLVLACLQSITTASSANEPVECCLKFQEKKIPLHLITEYKETRVICKKAGVIFIMKNGRRLCANPKVQWVKEHMDNVDLRLYEGTN